MKKEIIKPFDLEKAKAGAKLRTKCGCPVEIFKWNTNSPFPIKGIISKRLEDIAADWTIDGIWCGSSNGDLDLVIVEEVEEPKFKVGDWISGYYRYYKVLSLNNDGYVVEDVDGYKINILFENEKFHHLFTIADAKDGDVLVDEDIDVIGIFEGIEGMCWHSKFYYSDTTKEFYGIDCGGSHQKEFVHPATKEQRDTLFAKMKEAGYEWDAEKLELKKIENTRPMLSDFFNAEYERGKADALKYVEWSEEDKKNLEQIIYVCHQYGYTGCENWLKSLKQRIGG